MHDCAFVLCADDDHYRCTSVCTSTEVNRRLLEIILFLVIILFVCCVVLLTVDRFQFNSGILNCKTIVALLAHENSRV